MSRVHLTKVEIEDLGPLFETKIYLREVALGLCRSMFRDLILSAVWIIAQLTNFQMISSCTCLIIQRWLTRRIWKLVQTLGDGVQGGIELVHVKQRENSHGVMLCSGLTFCEHVTHSVLCSVVSWGVYTNSEVCCRSQSSCNLCDH